MSAYFANDVFVWGDRFLALLDEATKLRRERVPESPPLLPVGQLVDAYRKAVKRLLLLDYDGTLVPFSARPQDAAPDYELRTLLAQLTSDRANCVVVISGRSTADLQHWLDKVPRLGLAPEHGARWRMPGSETWEGRSAETEWKNTVRPILQHFVDRTPGSFIEEKEFALVWHFRKRSKRSSGIGSRQISSPCSRACWPKPNCVHTAATRSSR
jgi:trehalose 6-phosphate synthase/phosphatase